jgi:NitT/TauT family transport system permease protein
LRRSARKLLPWSGLLLVVLWDVALRLSDAPAVPHPWAVLSGLFELLVRGVLHKHVVASLFRVTWGYLLAVVLAVPLGLVLGSNRRGERAIGPLLQVLRPISPLAWIPIAILWFGVGDAPAIFIIFVACFLPLTLSVMSAVQGVPEVHLRAGRNFGLQGRELLRRVVLPAALPQLFVVLRLTLGIAWLVVVAAEMIAVNSGLGFLIVDSRNAGNRYDLVVAGMLLIGLIGLLLDSLVRRVDASVVRGMSRA